MVGSYKLMEAHIQENILKVNVKGLEHMNGLMVTTTQENGLITFKRVVGSSTKKLVMKPFLVTFKMVRLLKLLGILVNTYSPPT